jgi:WD40 repeat protein
VFVSYTEADRAYVTRLATHLATAGISFWYGDAKNDGRPLNDVVARAIDQCFACALVLTPESIESESVRLEVSYALGLGRPIHVLLLRFCAVPATLANRPTEDVRGGSMPSKAFMARLLTEPGAKETDRAAEPTALDAQSVRTMLGHDDGVAGVAIAPDSSWLISAGFDGTVRLWRSDGQPLGSILADPNGSTTVSIAPSGTWFASAGMRTVRLWESDGRARASLTGHDAAVWALAISPDGSWLASGAIDHTARLWTSGGRTRAVLAGHTQAVYAVAIAPDGRWLATGSADRTVRIWRSDGELLAVVEQPGEISSIVIAPNGQWLAVSSAGALRVIQMDGTSRPALEEVADIRTLAIAASGGWLAAGRDDGTIQLWRPRRGWAASLQGHYAAVSSVAVAGDGSWLASASYDHTVRTWAVSARGWVSHSAS